MSQSRSGKSDPVLEGVELLFHQKGGSASFGAIFEWSGSEFCELSCCILLVRQSAQMSNMISVRVEKIKTSIK